MQEGKLPKAPFVASTGLAFGLKMRGGHDMIILDP
jgi:hypothetical protein